MVGDETYTVASALELVASNQENLLVLNKPEAFQSAIATFLTLRDWLTVYPTDVRIASIGSKLTHKLRSDPAEPLSLVVEFSIFVSGPTLEKPTRVAEALASMSKAVVGTPRDLQGQSFLTQLQKEFTKSGSTAVVPTSVFVAKVVTVRHVGGTGPDSVYAALR